MTYTCVKYLGISPLNNLDTLKGMKDRKLKQVLSRRVDTSGSRRVKKEGGG
jgi:hypothetical protein